MDLSSHPSMLGVQDVFFNTSRECKYPTTVSLIPALSLKYRVINPLEDEQLIAVTDVINQLLVALSRLSLSHNV